MIKQLFLNYQWLLIFLLLNGCVVSRSYYGNWAFNQGEYNEAGFNLSATVRDNSNNQLAWQRLGISYYKLRKYEESRLALSRAFSLDPTDIKAGVYLTSVGYKLRDYQLVKETADQILPYIDDIRIRQIVDFYLHMQTYVFFISDTKSILCNLQLRNNLYEITFQTIYA